jgi:hypothetical protein
MTREELEAVITEILRIHACPCCAGAIPDRIDTILAATDAYAEVQIAITQQHLTRKHA